MKKQLLAKANDVFGDEYILTYIEEKQEFASYMVSKGGGNSVMGHYTSDFGHAIDTFRERVCADEEETEITWYLKRILAQPQG